MRAVLPALLALTACQAGSDGFELPLFAEPASIAPVEGLEHVELVGAARGALLIGKQEWPIEIVHLPSLQRSQHAVRGTVVALAGPARDGRFAYVTVDEERVLRLRHAALDGADQMVLRLSRPVHALSISGDGARAALLLPFPERDLRARGGALRELAWVDLASGELVETGVPCWNAAPAWAGPGQIALVVADEQGEREARVYDLAARALGAALAPADSLVCLAEGEALLAAARDDAGRVQVRRVPLDGGEPELLALRGVIVPLAVLPGGLLVSYAAPTLGVDAGLDWHLLEGSVACGTIKVHRLADGAFATIEARASPRRLWSAGG
jgi:hypothetical protein